MKEKINIASASQNEAKPTILVITRDEPDLSRVLSLVFKGSGLEVHIAATGTNGIQLAEDI